MRAEVAESWQRSAASGVDADTVDAPITLDSENLRDYRRAHRLAQVFPLLDDVLGQAARDCDTIMAVSDEAGQLLWVCGKPQVLREAEAIGFVEGSNWDERLAGTNAPGLALSTGRTATVIGAEHFRTSVRPWSCAATPIHDPLSASLLGVLDITGREAISKPETVALVRAAARMAESEIARAALTQAMPTRDSPGDGAHVALESLGRSESLLTLSSGGGTGTPMRLSPRHSEIVLLLASAPRGLSGDELAVLLYEDDGGESTLRAELNRLRHLLGTDLLPSRPYRLAATLSGDWLAVQAMLAAGDVRGAAGAYRGPLLPRSIAPGVSRLRTDMHDAVRRAILASGAPDLMSTWTRSAWGADDYQMWQAQRAALKPGSPLFPLVDGQISRLDREFGP